MDTALEKDVKKPAKFMSEKHRVFTDNWEKIFEAFAEGNNASEVGRMFNVSRDKSSDWKKTWLASIDFHSDEPQLILDMKAKAVEEIEAMATQKSIAEREKRKLLSRKITGIDDLRIRGMDIINLSLDRIEDLLYKEKNIAKLVAIVGTLMPYVATKKEAETEKGASLEERRNLFIQTIMNTYTINQNSNKHGTAKIIDIDGDSEE